MKLTESQKKKKEDIEKRIRKIRMEYDTLIKQSVSNADANKKAIKAKREAVCYSVSPVIAGQAIKKKVHTVTSKQQQAKKRIDKDTVKKQYEKDAKRGFIARSVTDREPSNPQGYARFVKSRPYTGKTGKARGAVQLTIPTEKIRHTKLTSYLDLNFKQERYDKPMPYSEQKIYIPMIEEYVVYPDGTERIIRYKKKIK